MTNVGVEVIAWNGLSHRRWTRRKTWNSACKLPTPPSVPAITIEADEAHHHPALSTRPCRSAFPHDRHRNGRFLMQNGRPNVQGSVQLNGAS
jgi:hypothetical protein